MGLFLCMSMCGTFLLLFALFLDFLVLKKVGPGYILKLYKLSLLFYLFPFQYFKYHLLDLAKLVINFSDYSTTNIYVTNNSDKISISFTGATYYFVSKEWIIFSIISFFVFVFFMAKQFIDYHRAKKQLQLLSSPFHDPLFDEILTSKYASKRKRKITLFKTSGLNTPITTGIFHTKIMLPLKEFSKTERTFIYSHELTHINNKDILIKSLCLLAIAFNWYNPFIYILYFKINQFCEYACDEHVLKTLTAEDKLLYGTLLINLAVSKSQKGNFQPKLSLSFTKNNKKRLEKRLTVMMNPYSNSKLKKVLLLLIACVVFLSCTSTVMAYHPADEAELSAEFQKEGFFPPADTTFIPESDISSFMKTECAEIPLDFSASAFWFVDENTNMYPVTDFAVSTKKTCKHTYKKGTLVRHIQNSNESCVQEYYHAKRCISCGNYVYGTFDHSVDYPKCLH